MGRGANDHIESHRKVEERTTGGWQGEPRVTTQEENVYALCGANAWAEYVDAEKKHWYRFEKDLPYNSRRACPKCIAKKAKRELAATYPNLRCEPDKAAKGMFRHEGGWRVYDGEDFIGYLGFESHYWRLYDLRLGDETNPDAVWVGTAQTATGDARRYSYTLENEALGYRCKEAALLHIPTIRSRLKTPDQLRQQRTDNAERWARRQEHFARQETEAEERRRQTEDGLREILDQHPLSNYQRDALLNAIARFAKPAPAEEE